MNLITIHKHTAPVLLPHCCFATATVSIVFIAFIDSINSSPTCACVFTLLSILLLPPTMRGCELGLSADRSLMAHNPFSST